MGKPIALWFDCCTTLRTPEARVEAARFFEVQDADPLQLSSGELGRSGPQVLVFDFDYPDQTRLRAMQHIKRLNPRYPILMLTVQHSEGLAVWSFRSRVWNYLVKPVQVRELQENYAALVRIVGERSRVARVVQYPSQPVPQEVPVRTESAATTGLQAAAYYVEQHFRERVRAGDVAKLCGMTRFAFSREFRRVYGMTFVDFLLRHRVREACRLLQAPRAAVTDVSFAVGFNDASYFGRVFKRYVGLLPSEYLATTAKPEFDLNSPPAGTFSLESVADELEHEDAVEVLSDGGELQYARAVGVADR